MKRVLIVASVASMIDQFNMENIKLLLSLGYKVEVAANFENPGNMSIQKKELLTAKLKQMRVKIHQIDFSRNMKQVKNHLIAYKQLKKVVADNKIDIIHCHSPIGGAISRLVGKTNNVKVIYTAHGFHFYKGAPLINWMLYFPIEYYLSKYTDQLIVINQEDYVRARKLFPIKNVHLVHGVGVDIKKIENIEIDRQQKKLELKILNEQIVLLSIGELNDNKNHELVIDCLKDFNNVNFKYLICGDGVLKEKLQAKIKQYDLEDKIELLGYRTDILELLKICDFFIFPSKREGLPVSIMEAMACRVPVIGSKIRGNSDLIQDNINGFLFSLDDRKEFIQIITKFLLKEYDEDDLNFIKENAFKSVQNYSLKNVLDELKKVYHSEID
ncbi:MULTISPECIES: glycosyltransferase family 4 protein [Lactobacillales]|uniref:Glycosyltransferase family 1 protein n=3 Tax=Enterococcus TaxID=1350 RepID=A0A3N3YRD8_ENTFL|nr:MULTISPECIES: glycosyltransferase family 4 protein [Lactobacillales]ROY45106.1 glycosyltransferase family 1 protein [Enterococcus faecalis]MDA5520367.1 glycosyltransferase family 4 protein [Streptococcus thermophilus]MDW2957764.1 glycosyltransferase family 4 protein [Streptococcus thermophilus]MDW3694306.1 glycosyltransferase family 4 protein [Enterococcus faecium]PQG18419.1 glycosyltransferase family 1 protein [Enterococcus faecium]